MAAFDYLSIRDEAEALMLEFGFKLKLVRYTDASDAVSGAVTRTIALEQELTAVILPASADSLAAFDVRFMSEVLEDTDVRFAILSAKGALFTPAPKDVALFHEAGEWQVMGCTPLNVNGIAVIYSIGLNRP